MSVNDPATWAPKETPDQLWAERSILSGILIAAVAYGVHATLFFITLRLLWIRPRTQWRDYIWIGYVLTLFTVSSIANGAQFKYTQMIYVDFREYPGGPPAYLVEQQLAPVPVVVNFVYIVNTLLQDGLILYRFWIIFDRRILLVVFPALVFLGSIGMTVTILVILTAAHKTLYSPLGSQLLLAYFSISVALNVLLTIAIVSKLMYVRHHMAKISKDALHVHVSVAAMLVESAFLYSAIGLSFLIPFGIGSNVQHIFLPVLGQAESIAPLLIIMRVAQGQAWSSDTAAKYATSTMVFRRTTATAQFQTIGGEDGGQDSIGLAVRNKDHSKTQVDALHVDDTDWESSEHKVAADKV